VTKSAQSIILWCKISSNQGELKIEIISTLYRYLIKANSDKVSFHYLLPANSDQIT